MNLARIAFGSALLWAAAGCQTTTTATAPTHGTPQKQEPWIDVKISTAERETIEEYVRTHGESQPGKKQKRLPPGLQKKVARGGTLPPGWQKKVARGEVMSDEVYQESRPLPPDLISRLPPPPKGTILITIEGKLVRLMEATREILDVLVLSGD